MAKEGLQLFGGDWTEQKLRAVSSYLRSYSQVLKKQSFVRLYIDAFAGTGYREQKQMEAEYPSIFDELVEEDPQRFLDGSAALALAVEPPFDRYVFIEANRRRVAELEQLKESFPSRADSIEIVHDDCNTTIQTLVRAWDHARMRGVVFLDPFGMQVEWQTLKDIAQTGAIDVWVLFPITAVNRMLVRRTGRMPASWRERLSRVFGTPDWLRRFYQERVDQDMFSATEVRRLEKTCSLASIAAFYEERLRTVFPVVASTTLRDSRDRPLFQLFFAAANPGRGGDIAKRIASHILSKI